MGKVRPIEIKYISQGHTVTEWQSQGLRAPAWPSGRLFIAAQLQRSEAAGQQPPSSGLLVGVSSPSRSLRAPTVFSLQTLAAAT